MNMPGINWFVPAVKPTFTQKQVDHDFLSTLEQCDLKQLVTDPKRIHGNTLDFFCTSRPEHVMNTYVSTPTSTSYIMKLYKDVDIDSFQQDMEKIKHKLSEINNGDDMWTLFSLALLRAVDKHVPKNKTKYNPPHSEPVWFNSDSRKQAEENMIVNSTWSAE